MTMSDCWQISLLKKQLVKIYRTLDTHRINKNNAFFSVNFCLTKQVDVCPMSFTVPVALPDNYKNEMREDVVVIAKLILYKRHDNDIYLPRIILGISFYHKNIKLTLGVNLPKSLDSAITRKKRYHFNSSLLRVQRFQLIRVLKYQTIVNTTLLLINYVEPRNDFNKEFKRTAATFLHVGYSVKLVKNIISKFNKKKINFQYWTCYLIEGK